MAALVGVVGFLLVRSLNQNKAMPPISEEKSLAKANEIYAMLQRGGDFATLAKKYSADPGSAKNGGNLGQAKKGMFVREFEEALLALEPGEVSKPVRSEYGYHLIQLLRRDEETFESRHILIRVTAPED